MPEHRGRIVVVEWIGREMASMAVTVTMWTHPSAHRTTCGPAAGRWLGGERVAVLLGEVRLRRQQRRVTQ
jgi:hypothetical protein